MLLPRYPEGIVREDLHEKMVFISGPRQVGKTTFAKSLLESSNDQYFNWDRREDRRRIINAEWPAEKALVILDELHKYGKWKSFIKGEYDTHGDRLSFLVAGSARLGIYRKGGDSLQGRYHGHRLHGFSVGELTGNEPPLMAPGELIFPPRFQADTTRELYHYGGFPEPFLKQNERSLRRWQKDRMDRFFREDIRDLESIRDLSSLELLADLLEDRVGSLLSLQSLREDLEVSHRAVSSWMTIFERLYFCFRIYPFAHHSYRSLKKAAKVYLWDWSQVSDSGARFENMIACHLLKFKHLLEDQEGYRIELYYLRDAAKREVDFLVTYDQNPWFILECKLSRKRSSSHLNYFSERLQVPWRYQVILEEGVDVMDGPVRVMSASKFLGALP